MTDVEQIDKAIGAHGLWKARLRQAIDTGSSDFDPSMIKLDNKCDFGKWLYGDISPELKKTSTYEIVLEYHQDFHTEAARVLELAVTGKMVEARKAMAADSKFAAVSAALTTAMMEWKKRVKTA